MIGRRGFLRALGIGTAAMVLDPERLLWVPGQKTIVDLGGIRLAEAIDEATPFLTLDWIVRDTLRVLEASLRTTVRVNRMYADDWSAVPDHRRVTVA